MMPAPRIAHATVGAFGPADLPAPELAALSCRATDKRVREYCAGRAAARAALRELVGEAADALLVLAEPEGPTGGRPRVWRDGLPVEDVHVSITHAGAHALAIAGRAPLGIDLVLHEGPLPPALVEEAFVPDELAAWRAEAGGLDEARRMCLAFAAKEAAVKWAATGLRLPLRAFAVLPASPVRPIEAVQQSALTLGGAARAVLRGPRHAELELFAAHAFAGAVVVVREPTP